MTMREGMRVTTVPIIIIGIKLIVMTDGTGDVCDADTVDQDGDGVDDGEGAGHGCDNCPATPNNDQSDSYPSGGNGCGDACECEGNFDDDLDVDGTDASTFKMDFGRSKISRSLYQCTSMRW